MCGADGVSSLGGRAGKGLLRRPRQLSSLPGLTSPPGQGPGGHVWGRAASLGRPGLPPPVLLPVTSRPRTHPTPRQLCVPLSPITPRFARGCRGCRWTGRHPLSSSGLEREHPPSLSSRRLRVQETELRSSQHEPPEGDAEPGAPATTFSSACSFFCPAVRVATCPDSPRRTRPPFRGLTKCPGAAGQCHHGRYRLMGNACYVGLLNVLETVRTPVFRGDRRRAWSEGPPLSFGSRLMVP